MRGGRVRKGVSGRKNIAGISDVPCLAGSWFPFIFPSSVLPYPVFSLGNAGLVQKSKSEKKYLVCFANWSGRSPPHERTKTFSVVTWQQSLTSGN